VYNAISFSKNVVIFVIKLFSLSLSGSVCVSLSLFILISKNGT